MPCNDIRDIHIAFFQASILEIETPPQICAIQCLLTVSSKDNDGLGWSGICITNFSVGHCTLALPPGGYICPERSDRLQFCLTNIAQADPVRNLAHIKMQIFLEKTKTDAAHWLRLNLFAALAFVRNFPLSRSH